MTSEPEQALDQTANGCLPKITLYFSCWNKSRTSCGLYLVDFRTTDDNSSLVNLETRMCYQYLSPLPFGFVTVVPRAVINSLSTLEFLGFLVGAGQGSPFVTEQVVDLWGYREELGDTSLPISIEDERIFDQDEDGLPGVSLSIETVEGNSICDVRVVQRNAFALEGSVMDGRRISGAFNVVPEQTVLSASSSLCSTGEVSPSTAGNRFELIRLPDDLASCGAVRDNLDRIRGTLQRNESTPDAQMHCTSTSP